MVCESLAKKEELRGDNAVLLRIYTHTVVPTKSESGVVLDCIDS